MVTRKGLEKQIDVLVRIIRSNEASLKSKTLISSARTLLEMQINTRSIALAALRQQLEDHSQRAPLMLSPNEKVTLRRIANSGARPSVLRGEDVKNLKALGLVIQGRLLVLTAAGRDCVQHLRGQETDETGGFLKP